MNSGAGASARCSCWWSSSRWSWVVGGACAVEVDTRTRALARLVLLPRDDPQFRRNKERINRDAERELISIEWELGLPDDDAEG